MSLCTQCHTEFTCAMADQTGQTCWCAELPVVDLSVLGTPQQAKNASCLCPACLHKLLQQQAAAHNKNR